MGIFKRKDRHDDLRDRTVRIDASPVDEVMIPADPVTDLCADIIAHPEDYEYTCQEFGLAEERLRHKDPFFSVFLKRYHGPHNRDYYLTSAGIIDGLAERSLAERAFLAHRAFNESRKKADFAAALAKIKADRSHLPLSPDQVRSAITVCRIGDQPAQRIVADIAEQMLPVLEGTHRIVAVGFRVTAIRNATRWMDHDGCTWPTRAEMRAANIQIKRRKAKAGGP